MYSPPGRPDKRLDSAGTITMYDYFGNFVYKNDVLQYITNEEGRARPIANDSTGNQTRFVYDYFVKDHLGNVRSTVTAEPINWAYLAGHELAMANTEQLVFDNIPSVRSSKPGSTNPADGMAARLEGGDPNTRVGTAIMLQVMPGDKFEISTDSYYEGENQTGEESGAAPLVSSLMSALMGGGTYAGRPISELPENMKIISGLLSDGALPGFLQDIQITDNPLAPKAHLNYLFFDSKLQLVPGLSGSIQVQGGGTTGWQNSGSVTIGPGAVGNNVIQPAYVIIYVDNQTIGKNVWFDNVHVEHYTSKLLEEDHYYPFGLTMKIDQAAQSNLPNQPYKFGTKQLEQSFSLNWYDFIDRSFDMQRGQFTQIDKKAEKYYEISPFAYSLNNPISFIDPDGKDPIHFSKLAYTGGWTDYLKAIPNAAVSIGQGVVDATWNSADANIQSLQRGTWLQDMGNEIKSIPGAAQQYVSNSVDYAVNTPITQQLKDAVSPQAVEGMLSFTGVMAMGNLKLPSVNLGFSSRAAAAKGGLSVETETTSLFHKGELQGGKVSSTRELSTGLNKETVEALDRPGKVWEFKVPNIDLMKMKFDGSMRQFNDLDSKTGVTNVEYRFGPEMSNKMNNYLVKPKKD